MKTERHRDSEIDTRRQTSQQQRHRHRPSRETACQNDASVLATVGTLCVVARLVAGARVFLEKMACTVLSAGGCQAGIAVEGPQGLVEDLLLRCYRGQLQPLLPLLSLLLQEPL